MSYQIGQNPGVSGSVPFFPLRVLPKTFVARKGAGVARCGRDPGRKRRCRAVTFRDSPGSVPLILPRSSSANSSTTCSTRPPETRAQRGCPVPHSPAPGRCDFQSRPLRLAGGSQATGWRKGLGGTGAPPVLRRPLRGWRGKMPHPRKWRKTFRKSIAELPEVRLPAAPKRLESGKQAKKPMFSVISRPHWSWGGSRTTSSATSPN